ncbi:hypothetical protein ACQ4PT_054636 [Festuca glaucescens]
MVWQRDFSEGVGQSSGSIGSDSNARWEAIAARDKMGGGAPGRNPTNMGNKPGGLSHGRPQSGDLGSPKTGNQPKDRATSIVITVLEGNPSTRDLEQEFNGYLGVWVEMYCKTSCQEPIYHEVRVKNIPGDKRCDENVAYVGSLVGITLEVDQATLHRPDFCRILLGCRDIDRLPEEAEGVLGDYFYTFFYEVESVLVNGEQDIASSVINASSSVAPTAPSPKRPRFDNNTPSESSEGQTDNSQFLGHGKHHCTTLEVVHENEDEDDENEGDEEEDLLINVITKQKQQELLGGENEKVEMLERLMVQNTKNGDSCNIHAKGMLHSTSLLVNDNLLPEKNVVSNGAEGVQGPRTPMISKELVVIENSWKVMSV